jgi:hypothetical protein
VFKQEEDTYRQINILRPFSAYDIPIQRRDPGPDGTLNTGDDGGYVTIYDYNAAYRGSAFVGNQYQTTSDTNRFHSIEGAMTRRVTSRWGLMGSFGGTRNHAWLVNLVSNPNELPYRLNQTWTWNAKISGVYQLPWDVQLSGLLTSQSGLKGQRTYQFRQTDPSGPPLVQQQTVTLRMEEYGSQTGPAINVVNLRGLKRFALGASQRLEVEVNLYNLLNTNAPNVMTFASGPTFGYVTEILPPRIWRFGVRYLF